MEHAFDRLGIIGVGIIIHDPKRFLIRSHDGGVGLELTEFRLYVLSPNAVSIGHASGKNATASATVCGDRALRIRVNRLSGAGAFKLAISRP